MRTAIALAFLACAACERDAGETVESPAGAAKILPHTLPPASNEPRFTGRWATSEEGCAQTAWVFTAARLVTPGHVACEFDNVAEAPGGYDIAATCTAESPPAPYNLELRFAESAQTMLISKGPMADVALVYCGPSPPT